MKTSSIIFILFFSYFIQLESSWQSTKSACVRTSSVIGNRAILLIDPAGHSRDVGRWIVEGYERAETLKFARALKSAILKRYKVYPVISRTPGEEILPLQIPSFANRLCANFFLRIHMYREACEKPKIFLYHHIFDPLVDFAYKVRNTFSLIPLNRAHCSALGRTKFCGNMMHKHLSLGLYKKYFDCYPLQAMPLRPLVGVCSPAILLEIGLCQEHKWKSLVEPVVASLSFLNDITV